MSRGICEVAELDLDDQAVLLPFYSTAGVRWITTVVNVDLGVVHYLLSATNSEQRGRPTDPAIAVPVDATNAGLYHHPYSVSGASVRAATPG